MPNQSPASRNDDAWSDWLLKRRHGNDLEYRRRMLEVIEQYRERVLDGARLRPGATLLDIGAGDGLIGFGAIARMGPSIRVILTDISQPLLQHAEQLARERGVIDQCQFIQAPADKLSGINDASINIVTTRSTLTYSNHKEQAFREFYRVLQPGGRISISEPVFQDCAFEACATAKLIETQPNHPNIQFLRLVHRYRSSQFPSTHAEVMENPLTNYNERDLFRLAHRAGFVNVHLELHIDLQQMLPIAWNNYLDLANHPWAPTLREVLAKSFSAEEAELFERKLRPGIEAGQSEQKQLVAYLTADKPG